MLVDPERFTPEQRNLAGELLGSGPFPGHDHRRGVGLRPDGLPDVEWVYIPEADTASGQREFLYQDKEKRVESDFWIARYPITHAQFQTFLDAADGAASAEWWQGLPESESAARYDQYFKFWSHPRDNVTWRQALTFCRWLSARAQRTPDLLPASLRRRVDWRITLPTEWQWEKAARGHDGRVYPWGNDYLEGYANIDEQEGNRGPHRLNKTSAVGIYPHATSPYGLLDMSGNVWEWCLNEYERPERTQETGNETRVLRGGSEWTSADGATAASRDRFYPMAEVLQRRLSGCGRPHLSCLVLAAGF